MIEYNPETNCIKTVSLHSFEEDEVKVGSLTRVFLYLTGVCTNVLPCMFVCMCMRACMRSSGRVRAPPTWRVTL